MTTLTKMTAKEARDNFSDLIGSVYYGNQVVEIDKKGRVFAVVINPMEYETLKKAAKGKALAIMKDLQKANTGINVDDVVTDVTSAVEQVRHATYEKSRQTESST